MSIRFIHLPKSVGGNPQGISLHLNKIGLKSTSWVLFKNQFRYNSDKYIYNINESRIVREIKKVLSLKYIFIFDVIFYNYGQTLFSPAPYYNLKRNKGYFTSFIIHFMLFYYNCIMQRVELFLVHHIRKIVLIQYQGDDARQGGIIKRFKYNLASNVDHYCAKSDNFKSKQINLLTKSCNKVYALNPDLMRVLPHEVEFLPYGHVPVCEWKPLFNYTEGKQMIIGHAPSDRNVKGTKQILRSIDFLKNMGYKFEFVLIEGKSHQEAIKIYKSVDLMIDQLFAGWYGGLVVECMALGKPTVSYIRQDDLKYIPNQMQKELPIINANPNNISRVLENTLLMPVAEFEEIALKSRNFVLKWHNPKKIAEKIFQDVNNIRKKNANN